MSLNMRYLLPLLRAKIMPSDQIITTQKLEGKVGLVKVQGVYIEERRHSRSGNTQRVFDAYKKAPHSATILETLTHMEKDEIVTLEALQKILATKKTLPAMGNFAIEEDKNG